MSTFIYMCVNHRFVHIRLVSYSCEWSAHCKISHKIWEICKPAELRLVSLEKICSMWLCSYSVAQSVSVKKRVAYRLVLDISHILLLLAGWWKVEIEQHTVFWVVTTGIWDIASPACISVGTQADWVCRVLLVYRLVEWAMKWGRRRHCIHWIHLHRNNYCTPC
jgi:hypothetical protein